jgi:flagellar hook protein FlgE
MSLYGMMRTSVAGMSAQVNRLSAVSDNIANSGSYGYKQARVEFNAQPLSNFGGNYSSGGVTTNFINDVNRQGSIRGSDSVTDLAIDGKGFFIVKGDDEQILLTRAGSFILSNDNTLENLSGQKLLGIPITNTDPVIVGGDVSQLVPVEASRIDLNNEATTNIRIVANLPSSDPVVISANLPAANAATAKFSGKTSIVTYDNLGEARVIDIYFAKTGAGQWQATAFDKAEATNGGFPYSSGPLATQNLLMDAFGRLDPLSASSVTLTVPGGQTATLDFLGLSQLADEYSVTRAESNGFPPNKITRIEINSDGVISGVYESGKILPIFQIAMAWVPSPDRLKPADANGFFVTLDSGNPIIGKPGSNGNGSIVSGALEESNVDMAEQLTLMIESQRTYAANSKVFQTGADLMDVLISLKR